MTEIEKAIKDLKNQYAKNWRNKNKDKVKKANQKYWLNKAKKELENRR
jgi:hypothetical protein